MDLRTLSNHRFATTVPVLASENLPRVQILTYEHPKNHLHLVLRNSESTHKSILTCHSQVVKKTGPWTWTRENRTASLRPSSGHRTGCKGFFFETQHNKKKTEKKNSVSILSPQCKMYSLLKFFVSNCAGSTVVVVIVADLVTGLTPY